MHKHVSSINRSHFLVHIPYCMVDHHVGQLITSNFYRLLLVKHSVARSIL